MADIAVQITCRLDGELKRIILDTVNDVDVQLDSTITNHPIVNGDVIADHMYKNPITMNIPGVFSLNGGMGIVVTSAGPKLANIQSLFERIKDEAVMCDIVKLTISLGDKGVRFQARSNMVLTSISWKERVNSLGFNFGFTQALVSEVQTYDVDIDDQFLPNVSEPSSMNFTDSLIDWTLINGIVISEGVNNGLIEKNFLDFMQGLSADLLVSLGVGAAVAVTVFLAIGSIPVAGWIAVGVTAAVVFLAGLIGTIASAVKANKFKADVFRKYKDDRKNQQEVVRFSNFIGSIHQQLEQLNNAIHCWQIGANEEQEAMVSIDNNYYIFTFTKNNTSGKYKLVITDIDGTVVGQMTDVTSSPTAFTDCTEGNKLFRAYESGAYVYLIRAEEGSASDLTSYFIVSTTLRPEKFEQTVTDIIINAMYR